MKMKTKSLQDKISQILSLPGWLTSFMHVNLVSFIIFFKIEIKRLILYTGKYSPAFYFWPLSPLLLAGKFKTGLLPNFVLANNISYNTIASGWIQDGKKPFASIEGLITLYTIITRYFLYLIIFFVVMM